MVLPLAIVLSTMHYEGDVPPTGGDFADVELVVPAGTREIRIAHTDGSDYVILDWGVWGPDGFRGWGGGNTEDAVIGVDQSSRSYRPGPITPGTWTVVIGKAPDMFEGVAMPELYLADALGAVGKPMMRVHTAGSVGGSTSTLPGSGLP